MKPLPLVFVRGEILRGGEAEREGGSTRTERNEGGLERLGLVIAQQSWLHLEKSG